jgi:hypothetical protein
MSEIETIPDESRVGRIGYIGEMQYVTHGPYNGKVMIDFNRGRSTAPINLTLTAFEWQLLKNAMDDQFNELETSGNGA